MRRLYFSAFSVLFILSATALADEPKGKLVKETWEAAFLGGSQIGHARTLVREIQSANGPVIETSMELELTLDRFGQQLTLSFIVADHESPDGKVLGLIVQQPLSKGLMILRKGKVVGNELVMTTEIGRAPPREKKIPWNDKVIGMYGESKLFQDKPLPPNTKFSYSKFVPEFDVVLATQVDVKDHEDVMLLGGKKKRLLRVESKSDKIKTDAGLTIDLPGETIWLDSKGEAIKRQMEVPGMGQLVLYQAAKAQALARGGTAPAGDKPAKIDIGVSQLVPLKQGLARPTATREVVYRVRVKDVEEPEKAFTRDEGQAVRNVKGNEFELVVKGLRQPNGTAEAEKPKEYLQSNRFIKSDDPLVKTFARQAVGQETDPWKQAVAVEQWVYQRIKNKNYTEAFATADEVAKTLEGDCTEHSVLAAAMCRAAGVPARGAIGLVYVPQMKAMAFHMWIEVWINGKWYPLDPTMNQDRVGADRIKVLDHHWNGVESFTPLLPVVKVIGKLEIEVAKVAY